MEIFKIEKDIQLICKKADSFPAGIMKAFDALRSKLPSPENRNYFGISYPEDSRIIYKAAAEQLNESEAKENDLETFIIKKGPYISIYISNFMNDIESIGRVFRELLAHPDIDPKGYCLEMYIGNNDVRCMVGIIPSK